MRTSLLIGCALIVALAGAARADDDPLLCVLSEHFDQVATYRIDMRDGAPRAAASFSLTAPHDAVFFPVLRILYVASDYKGRPCIVSLGVASDGTLRRLGDPVPTSERAPQLILSRDGRFLYAWTSRLLQIFRCDAEGGLPQPSLVSTAGVDDLLLSPDGRCAYTLQMGQIAIRPVDATSGWLGVPAFPSLEAPFGASALTLDSSGRHLYALSLQGADRHIQVYDLGEGGVRPASAPNAVTSRGAQKRIVLDGRSAYALNAAGNITLYHADSSNGALTAVKKTIASADGLTDLVFAPDHRFAYAVGTNDPSLWTYRVRSSDGMLEAKRPAALANGAAATRLLVLP